MPPIVFAGIRIVEFTTGIAAPYATMFFSDHGADVVKVEPPDGDPYRAEPGFQTLNRGKRSCVLDLRTEEGRTDALALAGRADVVVIDVPQGRARELGVDFEAVRELNPAAVYLAVPPYGERGPMVDRPASPALLAAANGTMAGQDSYSGDPVYLVLPLAAYGTAGLAATAAAAALLARERWGVGQMVEVSQLAGSLAIQVGAQVTSTVAPPRREGPSPTGATGIIPAYRLYEAADGKWFYLGCVSPDFYHKLLIAIGRPELAADPRLENGPLGHAGPEPRAVLTPILTELFQTAPRDHWIEHFRASDVPAQPVLTRDEYFDGPTVRANRMRMSVEHPQLGEVEMMGVPLVIESAPGKVRGRAPLLGEHTAAVLAEARGAAPTAEPPSSETAGPHLLSGVRVLDLTAYIAGPVSGRHLAMLGAEVIKVEPPRGEPFRVSGLGFLGWNQGKRGITLDLSTDDGREVLYRLVRQADVLLENYRPGVTDRLKVDYETLRRINPRLVYVTQPGFGADEAMRDAPLFDPMVQSLSGAVDAQGGDDEPSRYSVSISDTMHPLISTFGVCAALRQRERTGEGQLVRTALAMTGLAYQAAEFTRFADAAHLRGGIDYAGPSAGERWYRCEDGVDIFVEARTADQRGALVAATGVAISPAAVSDGAGGPAAESLKAAFATRPREQWITVLDDAGVPCNAIVSRGDVLGHPAIAANELVVMQSHAQWAETTDVGMLVHASATPGRIERPAPTLSEHSQEVLTELGYDREEQSAMARAGVVVLEPPEQRG